MEELAKKFAEYLGDPYVAAVGYGALAYGFFHWLDEKASDEAKAALARTMRFKDYKSEQVASALVEVFDRIYTYPLLRWRAFFRSLLFTTVVSAVYVFEAYRIVEPAVWGVLWPQILISLLLNVLSDYLSLFVIRPFLIRSGTKPVIGLILGTVSGTAIVYAVNGLRVQVLVQILFHQFDTPDFQILFHQFDTPDFLLIVYKVGGLGMLIGLTVFVWLPLFALGIVTARLLTPLSWIVGRTQWFLKEGKEHPLKAIGYVAAVVVFLGTVAGRAVFKA